jgi:NAD-dependent histone deacetylase SIR2
MPTIEVLPDAEQVLQQIADALLKSRKVVVITGAGISTNSGIPVSPPTLLVR